MDMEGGRAQRIASKLPGRTTKEVLANMGKYLPHCGGGRTLGPWEPRAVQYLTTVVHAHHRDAGFRNKRELRTIAEALDLMLDGQHLKAADILAARFSAVELAMADQTWSVSQHLELIPSAPFGAASERAKKSAAREEVQANKLRKVLTGKGSGRGSGTRGGGAGRHFE